MTKSSRRQESFQFLHLGAVGFEEQDLILPHDASHMADGGEIAIPSRVDAIGETTLPRCVDALALGFRVVIYRASDCVQALFLELPIAYKRWDSSTRDFS